MCTIWLLRCVSQLTRIQESEAVVVRMDMGSVTSVGSWKGDVVFSFTHHRVNLLAAQCACQVRDNEASESQEDQKGKFHLRKKIPFS